MPSILYLIDRIAELENAWYEKHSMHILNKSFKYQKTILDIHNRANHSSDSKKRTGRGSI